MKTILLTIGFLLSLMLASATQAQSIPLTIDSAQSSVLISVGGSASISQISGDANLTLESSNPPSGNAQITDLNLVLDNSLSATFALGLLAGSTSPGDVTVSLVTPGAAGTVAGGSFNQTANSLMLGGDLNVIDQFGIAGGSQTIDLSTIELSPTDFDSISVTQVGDTITVSSDFSINETLTLGVGPIPFVITGSFVATGVVPATPVLSGDVNLDGIVDRFDIVPFILILATGGFQTEADVNQNESVSFLDIRPFVALLRVEQE